MIVKDGLLHTIIEMPSSISVNRIDDTLKDFANTHLNEDEKEFILQMTEKKQLVKSDISFITTLRDIINIAKGKLYIVDVSEPVFNALCYNGIDKQIPIFKLMIDFEKDHGPVLLDDEEEESTASTVDQREEMLPKQSIMLLEPNITERNDIRERLNSISIKQITSVNDCAIASKTVNETNTPFNLILVDLDSTKQQAIQCLKGLKHVPAAKDTKVIVMITPKTDTELINEAMSLGAVDSIQKPIKVDELREKILGTIDLGEDLF